MKTILYYFLTIFITLNYHCDKYLPVIEYENKTIYKIIEGKAQGIYSDLAPNENLFATEDGIKIKNNKFRFNKEIKFLILKYYHVEGDKDEFSKFYFNEENKYPFQLDLGLNDTIKIINYNKNYIELIRKNKISKLFNTDSIENNTTKMDTLYQSNSISKREIWLKSTRTKLTYKGLLNLKTMKYIRENN